MSYYDYIIVGSGIAGLYTALLAKAHGSVLILTKGRITDCNSKFAQGGIAAPIGLEDSPQIHIRDTIASGDGLNDSHAVSILADEAAARITDLVNYGVPFDTVNGEIALTREAAHSLPRIIHAGGDATGQYIEETLSRRVRESGITVFENCLATGIGLAKNRVTGISTANDSGDNTKEYTCRCLILATGGAGQLFKYNTNSEIATGDGVALAYHAGAQITDMEFFQFHPTALRMPGVPPFLITEAMRGEGGILKNKDGRRFMADYTTDVELAPRDIVARSLLYEMQKSGAENVFLDISHMPKTTITTRFPHIYRFCLSEGLDITKEPIPVAPAAHYMMGGIRVNTWGETSIEGLYAAGETACTGVHGANRLASNSMLEVVVFSRRIIDRTLATPAAESFNDKNFLFVTLKEPDGKQRPNAQAASRENLQKLHWDKVGIIRDKAGLKTATTTLSTWHHQLTPPKNRAGHEVANLILTGRLMTEAALLREESRGAHFRTDFPKNSAEWQHHIVFTKG
ncbi:L-aspartate oxidase [Chloroflexota bacterium]